MMLNTKKELLIWGVFLILSGVTTSCKDDSRNLCLTIKDTEKITLDKLIEIDEGDDLQLVEGEYHLLKSDDIDETNTSVKLVTVNESVNIINSIEVINNTTYNQPEDVSVKNKESEGPITTEAHGIDEAVIEIGSLTASTPTVLTLKFEVSGGISYNDVTIDKMTITFPDFIVFKEGQSGLNGQTLTINNAAFSGSTYTKDLYITKYTFGDKYGDGKIVKEENDDRIIKIENEKITIKTDVTVHGANGSGSLSIAPTATLAAMTVSEVNGSIKPEMGKMSTEVELTNLPDFLQDDAVRLDCYPVFSFKANNPLNVDIEMDGIMTGYKNDKVTKIVKIGSGNGGNPVVLKPSGDEQQTISIVRDGKTTVETSATKIIVPNLNDIIEIIPDRISVELQPAVKTDNYHTVFLGKNYTLNSEYNIDIPLSSVSNIKIVHEEIFDNFNLDFEGVDMTNAILFSITAENTIPLNIEIKAENVCALDAVGNKIEGIDATVEGVITGSKDGISIATSQLNITLISTEKDAVYRLDGLAFKITAIPEQPTNAQLRGDQWLRFKDTKLKNI